MYQENIPSISRISSNEDASLKAISLLMNGFPIKIRGKELVLLDRVYERKLVSGKTDAIPSSVTLSEIPFLVTGISNEELNFIIESYRYNIDNKSDSLYVTKVISALYSDFSLVGNKNIEISEYYDAFSLEKTLLKTPLVTQVLHDSKLRFSSNTLKEAGKRIDRIDSIWEIDIPGENNKFVWGYGVNLKGEFTPPSCNIIDSEADNRLEESSLSY